MPATLPSAPPRPTVASVEIVVSAPEPSSARPPVAARVKRFANVVTVGFFALALGIPLFGFAFREQAPLDENRERPPFPPVALKRHVLQDFPQWFSMYFRDRVGYRDVLLGWHKHATFRWLDIPVSDRAWVGKDGWLYLNVADPFPRQPHMGTVNERTEKWVEAFAGRRAYLKARGIEYVVVLVPEKSSLYPEHLTGHPKRHPPPEPLAFASERLRAAGVPCVNLLPVLESAKARGGEPLYFATDSHWTPAGARAAYDAIAGELSARLPGFRAKPASHYVPREHRHPGDLRPLAGDTHHPEEPCRQLLPPAGTVTVDESPAFASVLPDAMKLRHMQAVAFDNPTADGPSVVLFRDSFGEALLPFLGTDFKRSAAVGTPQFPTPVMDAERPAVVIQQMVGRFLYSTSPGDEPAVAAYRPRR